VKQKLVTSQRKSIYDYDNRIQRTFNLIEKEELEHPKKCIFCVADCKEKEEIYEQNPGSSWVITCDLVLQYCKEKGLKTCDHENAWLVNESLSLSSKISNLLQAKSEDKHNSLALFKVLGDYFDEDNAPTKLQEIINTVGKNWIKSLNPFDYDFGYLDLVKRRGEGVWEGKTVPPYHPNIFRTDKEWAKICNCDDCQEYWVRRKNDIEEAEKELEN